MLDYIRSWFIVKKGEKGQDLAEYALLIGLIALIVILVVTLLGGQISTIFANITSVLSTVAIPGGGT
jgi:pilus assembly protein Flp/PilA